MKNNCFITTCAKNDNKKCKKYENVKQCDYFMRLYNMVIGGTYRTEKIIKNNCNLTNCRYNQSGTCTNEDNRKECVEVSKKILCLDDVENEIDGKTSK